MPEVVWNGASRQMLCGGLERDYAAMQGDGWDVIYIPPSPLTTPWHGLSDADLRRLYLDDWQRSTRLTVARNVGAGGPAHRPPAKTGLMTRLLQAAQSPKNTSELLALVQRWSRRRVVDELTRLVRDGRMVRTAGGWLAQQRAG